MLRQHYSLRHFCSLMLSCLLLCLSLAACGSSAGNAGGNTPTAMPTSASAPTPTATPVLLRVTSVDITVGPSLNGHLCGSQFTETYTATFHFPAHNTGAQVQFQYTTNNGRSSTPAGIIVPPGQTSATFQFHWSGQLPADHTEPGPGGVIITSPNSYTSPLVTPSGTCTDVTPSAFKVVSIELSASPSLSGHACGSNFTEKYTAIFHIAPGGPGGQIVFQYTTNNGRSSTNATLHVAAGQTSATFQFQWSGQLPADHTAPGTGIVLMSSPNQGESPSASPAGQCTIV